MPLRPNTRNLFRTATITTVGILALTGCATSSGPSTAIRAAGVDSNAVSTKSQPDFRSEDVALIRYAQDFLLKTCVVDNGYPELAQYLPDNVEDFALEEMTVSASTFLYSSEEEARRKGFGQAEPASPEKYYVHDDGTYSVVFDTCDKLAWEELGNNGLKTFIDYNNLVGRVTGEGWRVVDEATPELGSKIDECLTDKGTPITDENASTNEEVTFWGMTLNITKGALQRPVTERSGPAESTGIEVMPGEPENLYVPTTEESDLAAAVYECSNTTTVRADLDNLINTAMNDSLKDNSEELSRLTESFTQMVERAHELTDK